MKFTVRNIERKMLRLIDSKTRNDEDYNPAIIFMLGEFIEFQDDDDQVNRDNRLKFFLSCMYAEASFLKPGKSEKMSFIPQATKLAVWLDLGIRKPEIEALGGFLYFLRSLSSRIEMKSMRLIRPEIVTLVLTHLIGNDKGRTSMFSVVDEQDGEKFNGLYIDNHCAYPDHFPDVVNAFKTYFKEEGIFDEEMKSKLTELVFVNAYKCSSVIAGEVTAESYYVDFSKLLDGGDYRKLMDELLVGNNSLSINF